MTKQHTENTLKAYTKEELVEHCMCLEHNVVAMESAFEIQYKNCVQLINDMNVLNETYKKAVNRNG